jgi:hypothetical protein
LPLGVAATVKTVGVQGTAGVDSEPDDASAPAGCPATPCSTKHMAPFEVATTRNLLDRRVERDEFDAALFGCGALRRTYRCPPMPHWACAESRLL